MSYTFVDAIPANSAFTGDVKIYFPQGYLDANIAQSSYGETYIYETYQTPTGENVARKKFHYSTRTPAMAAQELADGGYRRHY